MAQAVENNVASAIMAVAGSANSRLNDHRSAKFLSAGTQIQRVQPMNIIRVRPNNFLGFRLEINCPRLRIDDRRAGDPDLRGNVSGTNVRIRNGGHSGGRIEETGLPKGHGVAGGVIVRIERVNARMSGGDEYYVVDAFVADRHIRHVQRLRINLSINRVGEKFAERISIDVRKREDYFVQILATARVVVVVRQHLD